MHLHNLVYNHTCKNGTKATIIFTNKSDSNPDYKFESCNYVVGSNSVSNYTIKDWEDMKELSDVIIKQQSILTNEHPLSTIK